MTRENVLWLSETKAVLWSKMGKTKSVLLMGNIGGCWVEHIKQVFLTWLLSKMIFQPIRGTGQSK
jgi:hypothetical protein